MKYIAISLQANVKNVGSKEDFIVFEVGYASQGLLNNLMRKCTSSIKKVT
jgi:hypothetical protein